MLQIYFFPWYGCVVERNRFCQSIRKILDRVVKDGINQGEPVCVYIMCVNGHRQVCFGNIHQNVSIIEYCPCVTMMWNPPDVPDTCSKSITRPVMLLTNVN